MWNWAQLLERIESGDAKVAVIGLGYVGLPLAVAFARKGYRTLGYDVDRDKVEMLAAGRSYVLDMPSDVVEEVVADGRFSATTDVASLRGADVVIICVPTPFTIDHAPDLSYIESAARGVAQILRRGQLVVLESTSYPGTTEEMLVPILGSSGLSLYEDFQVAFSPERIDPGNPVYHVENTPKVVGGLGGIAGELACALYGSIIERIVPVNSPRDAEMAKLIENTFRQVNIALANELALIASKMGVNIWQAIEAASSKPHGYMPFYPGPGVGGHCIPIDPHYLNWKAQQLGFEISFIELAERINQSMPSHVAELIEEALSRVGKPLEGASVLMLGVSYKRDVDDLRESPALALLELLHEAGARVVYHDPYVATYKHRGVELESTQLSVDTLTSSDCVVLVTDHSCYDKDLIVEHARAIVDTRNAFKDYSAQHIIRL